MQRLTMYRAAAALALAGLALTVLTAPAAASAKTEQHDALALLPHCAEPHGNLVIKEPGADWWTPLGLPSPEAVLKVYVMRSGCFRLLDRGRAFEAAKQERNLADSGELDNPAKLAKGQVIAADFAMVPDLVSKNADASGSRLTAVAGMLLGGPVGGLIGSIKVTEKTADVTLSLTDVRTLEQRAINEGHGQHSDWGFGAGGGLINATTALGIDLGTYQNTDVGQVVMLAYLDAYQKMLRDLGYKAEVLAPLPLEGKEIALTP